MFSCCANFIFENYGADNNYATPQNSGRIELDPTKYGKGILNAPHALLYATILYRKRIEKYREINHLDIKKLSKKQLKKAEKLVVAGDAEVKTAFNLSVQGEEEEAKKKIKRQLLFKTRDKINTSR